MIKYLAELAANNNRPWFLANKERFDALRETFIRRLEQAIALSTEHWPELAHTSARECIYRIYRDTRFSPDKTPYKTYFSAVIAPGGRRDTYAGFYIQAGLNPDDCGLFAGIWCPDADTLRKLRRAIADNDDEFREIAQQLDAIPGIDPEWCGEKLKTAPKGWPKDHPMIKYLRLKHIGRLIPIPAETFDTDAWPRIVADYVRQLMPLIQFINYSLDEEI